MKTNNPELYNSNIIDEMFNEISKDDFEKTNKKMKLALKISDALQAKGWSKSKLANEMNQKPSVITKWLSGTHNFTADTLIDIELMLEIRLLSIDETAEVVVYMRTVEVVQKVKTTIYWDSSKKAQKSSKQFMYSGNLLHQENSSYLPC
jgi:transcriptional regulator with XRE-family HTH domain